MFSSEKKIEKGFFYGLLDEFILAFIMFFIIIVEYEVR